MSPRVSAQPPETAKRAWMSPPVLVLWTRTSAGPSARGQRPWSTANGPTADEMLPQLAPRSTTGRSTATWAKV
jgi:hypothetical protein